MRTNIRRRLALALLALPLAAMPALAQGPTPEGTTITNTATATWTDANGNAYDPITADASVTVGFGPGPDVTSAASATPASPSTGNTLDFTITNGGNGVDSMTVSTTPSAGVTVTGYVYGGTPYTLAELNDVLSTVAINPAASIVVTVVYSVAPGQGGASLSLSLTATSRRDPSASAASDASSTDLNPGATAAVAVTPDGGTVSRLPSNGTQYTATFTIENNGNASDTYALTAGAAPGTNLTIVSVNGTAGASGSVVVASGATETVDVIYEIANTAAAGATESLTLTATSGIDAGQSDDGSYTITVIRAALAMQKEVFRDDQTTAITGAMTVVPGEHIQYRITVTNSGGGSATSVEISDPLPAQVTYVSSSADAAGWTISESGGTVTGELASLAPAASRYFWIRVQVK